MDLASLEKPDWLTDEEWEALQADLRKGRFLSEIRPPVVALVRAGANRRGFFSAKSEDEMTLKKKAAGDALKVLMAYQQKIADIADKIKNMDPSAELDDATVSAIGKLGQEMAALSGGDAEAKAKADAQTAADEKARKEAEEAKKLAEEEAKKVAEESKKAAEAIADETVKKAVEAQNDRFAKLEKRISDLDGKVVVVEKSTGERKDELTLLTDLVESVINPTSAQA